MRSSRAPQYWQTKRSRRNTLNRVKAGCVDGLTKDLQRHHARQLHLEARAAHRAVVIGDDVDAIEEHRLDRVLPRPQRQRVITQRPEVRVQHQGRPTRWRYMSVQADAPTST